MSYTKSEGTFHYCYIVLAEFTTKIVANKKF